MNTGALVSAEIIALPAKIKNMSMRFFTLLMMHHTISGLKFPFPGIYSNLSFETITALIATASSFSFTVSF